MNNAHTPRIPNDAIYNGARFSFPTGTTWTCMQDGGSWWLYHSNKTQPINIGEDAKHAARWITERDGWIA